MHKFMMIIWLLVLCVGSISAQEHISPELQTQLDEIETATSVIRKLDRLESTDLAFPTATELEVYLREEFDKEFATDEFADDLLFYVGLDLMDADIDIEAVLFEFLVSQVAGFYDPEEDSMNVILMTGETPEDSIPVLESLTYSHEYVHALQDQHFDLEMLFEQIETSENGDFQLAVLALVEGDATQVMTDFTFKLAEEDPMAMLGAVASAGDTALPEGVPPILEAELLFPYFEGQVFVSQVVNASGWDAINEAYNGNLPLSTEHILHPERYLAGEMPIDVTVPDFAEQIGDNWRLVQDTQVGEFYLREHLGTQLSTRQSRDMADGWGGDKMKLYVDDATGVMMWVIYQVWDTAEDATEFAEGYVEFLDARFGTSSVDGTCWVGDDTMCITQIDDDETRISMAINSEMAMMLLHDAD